jgi:tRNA-2-methylthio-N6-dimethylallyladenosine synthase
MVEGKNDARGQIVGRTSQNKTLNFVLNGNAEPGTGDYVQVKVTQAFPNSLLGELVQ